MAVRRPFLAVGFLPAEARALLEFAHAWLTGMLELARLEGRQAAPRVALAAACGAAAFFLLVFGWVALVATAAAALVESGLLGWTWSLLVAALLHLAGAAGLVFLAWRNARKPLFAATRRQLGMKPVAAKEAE